MSSILPHSHSADAIRRRLEEGPSQSYLRDWIYGGIDGAITTFAIVAGVVGADLSARIIVILGLANIFADGFSMAASNFSATKSESDEYQQLRHYEEMQVRRDPTGERNEIREIYRLKGFEGNDLDRAVDIITSDAHRWVDTMMAEEYGMQTPPRSASKAALSTFWAFLICGAVPLLPFMFVANRAFEMAIILTGLVFFAIGSGKSRWSLDPWWRAGLETIMIGLGAAAIAYGIGYGLQALV